MSFENVTIRRTKNGYILDVESKEVSGEGDDMFTTYDSSTYVFNKPSGLKKAVAILLKEEDK